MTDATTPAQEPALKPEEMDRLEALRAAAKPFTDALTSFDAICLFGSPEAGIVLPDETPMGLFADLFEDKEDAPQVTLGDLRNLHLAVMGERSKMDPQSWKK